MTWWSEEQEGSKSYGTKARQRWAGLSRDARDVVAVGPDNVFLAVLWPMSGWQVWRRLDKEWCEYVCDAASRDDAMQLGMQAAQRSLRAP